MLEYLPRREERRVTIFGYAVPRVEARELREGRDCDIVLDGRFGITVPASSAEQVIWLVANAMAIAPVARRWRGYGESATAPFKRIAEELEQYLERHARPNWYTLFGGAVRQQQRELGRQPAAQIVVGRPIWRKDDPLAAAQHIIEEMGSPQ